MCPFPVLLAQYTDTYFKSREAQQLDNIVRKTFVYDFFLLIMFILHIVLLYRFGSITGVLENIREKDKFSETYKILLGKRCGMMSYSFLLFLFCLL
jgi:hypothetical protein